MSALKAALGVVPGWLYAVAVVALLAACSWLWVSAANAQRNEAKAKADLSALRESIATATREQAEKARAAEKQASTIQQEKVYELRRENDSGRAAADAAAGRVLNHSAGGERGPDVSASAADAPGADAQPGGGLRAPWRDFVQRAFGLLAEADEVVRERNEAVRELQQCINLTKPSAD